jgi:dTDP-4-amino-4,6-dideoxygalactose transaminase
MIDLAAQQRPLQRGILRGWKETLERGSFILGPNVRAFEEEAARFLKVKHAVACNSGTDALFIALRALGVGPGDEVIVPAFSFFATAEAVSIIGAKPVFADIRGRDFLLDLDEVRRLFSRRTKAVIPVHLYGNPMDLRPLRRFLKGRAAIVEDACQAFGAKNAQGMVGGLGDAAAFSFYPTKNLSAAGDAGLLTTGSDGTARLARMLREHGSPKRYVHELVGYNSRMDELQAVVLRAKLPRLKGWNAARAKVAAAYLKGFKDLPLGLPLSAKNSVWHQFTLRVPQGRRDALKAWLESKGVASAVFYPGKMNR